MPQVNQLHGLIISSSLLLSSVFGGAILDTLEDKRREREMNDLKELVVQHATRDELDRLKQDTEHLEQTILEKRNETL